METYVMQNAITKEKVTCYWYEALSLRQKGWIEVDYIPDFDYADLENECLIDEC